MKIVAVCALLWAGLGFASLAHASTSNCSGVGDGTSCSTTCISSGTCLGGTCVPGVVRANGTACSSEDRCTTGDSCENGLCTNGTPLNCPNLSSCERGACLPSIGCVLVDICKPDFATDMSMQSHTNDAGMSFNDAGMSVVDMSLGDLHFANPDMCYTPPHSSFEVCHGDDGAVILPFDLSATDANADLTGGDGPSRYGHVRGSRAGDCSFAGSSRQSNASTTAVALVLLALLALALRSGTRA